MQFLNKISGFLRGKLLKDLGITVFLQMFARLFQMLGMFHVANCYGDLNGESNQALVSAQYLQFILTFGLDIVAVRHLASKSISSKDLVSRMFTIRICLYGLVSICWYLWLQTMGLSSGENKLWLAGILNLFVLGMNFQWVFQGLQKMPIFSLIQSITAIIITSYFLLIFKPGIEMGADLWVMGTIQGIVTLGSWYYIKLQFGISLINFQRIRDLSSLVIEGMPNWIFGLFYNTLITFGMLSIKKLTSEGNFPYHEDSYANLSRIAMATQMILAFGGSVIYTRVVVWRNERNDFFLRVPLVCGAVILIGVLSCSVLHIFHPWLYPLIFPKEIFHSAGPFLSITVFGRFLGLTSGILVWSLLAYHKDWMAVKCAFLPVVVSVVLHFIYVPRHGLVATTWLYVSGELGLFLCCFVAFLLLKKQTQSPTDEKSD
jgi:O-antigen/teichoic acid export membrane protein